MKNQVAALKFATKLKLMIFTWKNADNLATTFLNTFLMEHWPVNAFLLTIESMDLANYALQDKFLFQVWTNVFRAVDSYKSWTKKLENVFVWMDFIESKAAADNAGLIEFIHQNNKLVFQDVGQIKFGKMKNVSV